MRSRPVVIALLLALTGLPANAAPATDDWRLVRTSHFTVLSQLGERETTSWIRSFDQFIAATAGALGFPTRNLPPLTVILFRRDRDYAPYKLLKPNGRTANVAGQFARWPSWSVMALAADGDDQQTRQTIYHEGTHWLMSVDPGRQPAWFAEGIAEMLSTFEQKGKNVNWAKPIDWHLVQLNQVSPMPLEQFLVQKGALFDRESHTDRFYAQSWAFVHFMMMSKDPQRRQQLTRFLQAYKSRSGEAAVQEVFGDTLPALQSEFIAYTRQRMFGYFILPATPTQDPPPSVPAPGEMVEAALGFLALGAGHFDLAKQHAERALSLAPDQPGGRELMAYLASEAEETDSMLTHARAALRAGSRDSQMYLLMGDSYAAGPNADTPNARATRATLYEQAINLDPLRLDLYFRLAETLFNHDQVRADDRKFLELGLRLYPGEDFLKVAMGATDWRLGQRDKAFASLEQALRPDTTLDGAQRTFVEGLRRSWWVEVMNEELSAAVKARDLRGARAILERYRERLSADADIARYITETDKGFAEALRRAGR